MGTGDHLHKLIKQWTGEDFAPGCSCRATVREMNKNTPQWSRDNMGTILRALRQEAKRRHWWGRVLNIPGTSTPIRWMINEAIRRAEADLKEKETP